MATSRRKLVSIKLDELVSMADGVGRLNAAILGDVAVNSLNTVAGKVYDLSRDRITAGINVRDDYLRDRMSVTQANKSNLTATITADGTKHTQLVRYNAMMVLAPATGKRKSRATGMLRIPPGQKQTNVRVEVTRGAAKPLRTPGVLLPLMRGKTLTNEVGVFQRQGGKLRLLYGPSAYQLFGYQANNIADEATQLLADEWLDNLEQFTK